MKSDSACKESSGAVSRDGNGPTPLRARAAVAFLRAPYRSGMPGQEAFELIRKATLA
eukprot:CAMPEP_0202083366 /NCGR_PEP_ID=MMETSP0964-20121228/23482_1 /ASSEMBLY_ACC=CAM_ASM_000500 /TAXON_ID=4773 /ORGANISM="Schizochytrium aggregatum, Strain ATCC28209" /LENGTH=56 /DNA_ID=CAMNT_0048651073 /DNA_START=12 /DNA_END=179 /DNA_ORIENTATION=+